MTASWRESLDTVSILTEHLWLSGSTLVKLPPGPLGDRVFQPSWYDQKDEKETFSHSSLGEQFELSTAKYNATEALLTQKFKLTAQHKIPPNLIGELTDALAKKVTRHKKPKKQ